MNFMDWLRLCKTSQEMESIKRINRILNDLVEVTSKRNIYIKLR